MSTRRRRARASLWTHKKSHTKLQRAPDEAEWAALEHTQVGAFVFEDENGSEVEFRLNDVGVIFPEAGERRHAYKLEDSWLAKIKGIRVRSEDEVWVAVNWYYSPLDIKEKMPGLLAHCAKRERIYSHHSELIPASIFEVPVPMMLFLEDDPEQQFFPGDRFFCRYFFDANPDRQDYRVLPYTCSGGEGEAPSSTPKRAYDLNACICGAPYSPDDTEPARVMHWCPRPQCRRAHHYGCLLAREQQVLMTAQDAAFARLESSPDANKRISVDPRVVLDRVPAGILRLAGQPIVRGGAFGITGNVACVVHARRAVYDILRGDADFDALTAYDDEAGWADAIVEPYLYFGDADGDAGRTVSVLFCPGCGGAV
ncbi:hypothetical protein B0H15DRAFT_863895 [Mycena belliarum]|uniref:BAH domain-containing protein n=1 Tax=Mycena belliarum TaxID=1033014 RepID=A0AAD6XG05_9AGAR|nr:hypothetical protein B0H15DRAFT_863895 [Mycena belliae]